MLEKTEFKLKGQPGIYLESHTAGQFTNHHNFQFKDKGLEKVNDLIEVMRIS